MINVLDINDNTPMCPGQTLEVQVQLDTPVNSTIFRFMATDRDIGENSLLVYTLEGFEQELKFFTIDSTTGDLQIVSSLPPSNRNLRITVNASDSGEQPLSIDCDVLITLYNFNNTVNIVLNTSQFDKEIFETVLAEVLGIPVVVVEVITLDNGSV